MFTDADRAFLRELLIVPDIGAEPSDAVAEIANTDAHIQPKTPEDYERLRLTHEDRVFLHGGGAGLYALSYCDGWYWHMQDRDTAQVGREFAEVLKRDWAKFERRFEKKNSGMRN